MPAEEHTLLATTDAQVWAEEFCRIFDKCLIFNDPEGGDRVVGIDTMLGWFANAIETGRNLGRVCRACGRGPHHAHEADHPHVFDPG